MSEEQFWKLIEDARGGDRSMDGEAFSQALEARLSQLPPGEIEAFQQRWQEKMVEAYRWDLWGAAYLINGGCSDDCFDYFRGFLISLGRGTFERALRDPESVAEVPSEDDVEWEGPSYAASAAYVQATGGKQLPFTGPRSPTEPAGVAWDEDELPQLLPRLAEQVGY